MSIVIEHLNTFEHHPMKHLKWNLLCKDDIGYYLIPYYLSNKTLITYLTNNMLNMVISDNLCLKTPSVSSNLCTELISEDYKLTIKSQTSGESK